MTDDLQAVAKSYTYEAFGKIRGEAGTGLLFPNRYTYTARESMGDSAGLYYYRWRVMDPNVGRFTSEDPLSFEGKDITLYRYADNNPIKFVDPFGDTCKDECKDDLKKCMKKAAKHAGACAALCGAACIVSPPACALCFAGCAALLTVEINDCADDAKDCIAKCKTCP
ncbi:MAG: hypothetical protein PCFJNLEI_02400 [Verrucomicrobiae bacterium]|nr:hypothetical protein [Verrucomicrobiae bacterium]